MNPQVTIQQKGCALTSSAMLLSYLANKTVSPQDLNNWLGNNSGYANVTISGQNHGQYTLIWEKVAQYARNVLGLQVYYNSTKSARNDTQLNQYLSSGFPVVLAEPGHFVVATCQNVNVTGFGYNYTYNIADPGHMSRVNLNNTSYNNSYTGMRLFSTVKPPSLGSMTATAHSPVYMTITNPAGEITGPNISEIPNSGYSLESLQDDTNPAAPLDPPTPMLDLVMPMNGTYTFDVVGTGSGKYTIDFLFFDNVGNSYPEQLNGTATLGSLDVYDINYTDATGSHVQITQILSTTESVTNSGLSSSVQSNGTLSTYLVGGVVLIAIIVVSAIVMIRRRKTTLGQQ